MNDIAIKCCDESHTTNFCPHCGKALMRHSLHGLLRHCENSLLTVKRKLDEAQRLNNKRHANSAQNAIEKWQSWVNGLRKAIQASETVGQQNTQRGDSDE